jgi:hypothetical protein
MRNREIFVCLECGKKFYSAKSAENASNNGCPKCGGVDIDLPPGEVWNDEPCVPKDKDQAIREVETKISDLLGSDLAQAIKSVGVTKGLSSQEKGLTPNQMRFGNVGRSPAGKLIFIMGPGPTIQGIPTVEYVFARQDGSQGISRGRGSNHNLPASVIDWVGYAGNGTLAQPKSKGKKPDKPGPGMIQDIHGNWVERPKIMSYLATNGHEFVRYYNHTGTIMYFTHDPKEAAITTDAMDAKNWARIAMEVYRRQGYVPLAAILYGRSKWFDDRQELSHQSCVSSRNDTSSRKELCSMSKKHFIALAEYLRDTSGYCEPFTGKQIEHLANFCHSQNPAFKRGRWMAFIRRECGPNGGILKGR